MQNNFNLPAADIATLEELTPAQLSAIRSNIQSPEYSDDETREAAAQYIADGGELLDLS